VAGCTAHRNTALNCFGTYSSTGGHLVLPCPQKYILLLAYNRDIILNVGWRLV
jgi:hypothetical protein